MGGLGASKMFDGREFWRDAVGAGRYVNSTCQKQTIGDQNNGCKNISARRRAISKWALSSHDILFDSRSRQKPHYLYVWGLNFIQKNFAVGLRASDSDYLMGS